MLLIMVPIFEPVGWTAAYGGARVAVSDTLLGYQCALQSTCIKYPADPSVIRRALLLPWGSKQSEIRVKSITTESGCVKFPQPWNLRHESL